jgi:hypothetical protein
MALSPMHQEFSSSSESQLLFISYAFICSNHIINSSMKICSLKFRWLAILLIQTHVLYHLMCSAHCITHHVLIIIAFLRVWQACGWITIFYQKLESCIKCTCWKRDLLLKHYWTKTVCEYEDCSVSNIWGSAIPAFITATQMSKPTRNNTRLRFLHRTN